MNLDFLVARRGIDPAAETCATALRELLDVDVRRVERAELWRFEVAGGERDRAALQERIESAACRAGRYVNRNRDVCVWWAEGEGEGGAAEGTVDAVDKRHAGRQIHAADNLTRSAEFSTLSVPEQKLSTISDPERKVAAAGLGPGCVAFIWVCDGDGRDTVALAWFRAGADADLSDLRRGILWKLWLPIADPAAARAAAMAITVARDRRHGLLVNPHSQSAEILRVVPHPGGEKETS